jgi:hypothetical protein
LKPSKRKCFVSLFHRNKTLAVVINQRFVSLFHRKCFVSAAGEPGRVLALAVNNRALPALFPMLFKIATDPTISQLFEIESSLRALPGVAERQPPGARVCDDAVQHRVAP